MDSKTSTNSVYDTMIRMFMIILIVGWCLAIMMPFVHIILWGIIIAIAFLPLHQSLSKKLGGKPKLASTIIVLVSLAIVLIPSWLFIDSIVEGIQSLKADYKAGTLTIPPPSDKVKSWPVIGEQLFTAWSSGSEGLKGFLFQYKEQLAGFFKTIVQGLMGNISAILQMAGSVIIAGILLVVEGTGEGIRRFFRKLAGSRGDEYADITKMTVGNVVKGVLGVALIQSFVAGLGFLLAGVPFAGLWTLLVFILGVLQIPALLVILPVVIYIFSVKETTPAVLWTIYLLVAGLSDNVLKPILLGKGAPVPMLVIFIGVIGGFVFSGFIGLFTGAIIMSIGYKIFVGWLNQENMTERETLSSPSAE
jgi:predicted PurR-regulated permease PerM